MATAFARRMIDGVGDGRGHASDADLTDAFRADGRSIEVWHFSPHHINVGNVSMDRHVILSQVVVGNASEAMIPFDFFMECMADAHDHAAQELTASRLGIENHAACKDAEHAPDANYAKVFVHGYFDELCTKRVI